MPAQLPSLPPVQRIPQEVDLPPIVPAPLVKPTPPANLKPTAEEQQSLFTCVVPDNRWAGRRSALHLHWLPLLDHMVGLAARAARAAGLHGAVCPSAK